MAQGTAPAMSEIAGALIRLVICACKVALMLRPLSVHVLFKLTKSVLARPSGSCLPDCSEVKVSQSVPPELENHGATRQYKSKELEVWQMNFPMMQKLFPTATEFPSDQMNFCLESRCTYKCKRYTFSPIITYLLSVCWSQPSMALSLSNSFTKSKLHD